MTSKHKKLGDGDQIVGAFVPRRIHDILNLLALDKGVSKSDIIRDAIHQVIPDEKQITTIIQNMARWAVQNYFSYKSSHIAFVHYKQELRKKFFLKNISTVYIEQIMQEVSKRYAENKKAQRSSQRRKETAQKGRGTRT